ncbi:MAG: hypothetical protein H7Z14_08855, partial [Anaerolineae bacterium]|nr:hypothetical protein [Phycisphaerae bacterium]
TDAPDYQTTPKLAGSGDGGVKMLYTDQASQEPGIAVSVVSPADTLIGQADVSLAAPSQAGSKLASDGNNFLAVFASSTAYGTRLLAQRVNPQGVALDAEPFVIADSAAKPGGYEVVYLNGRYVVLFSAVSGPAGNQIYARTVSIDGAPGDFIPVMTMQSGVGFGLGDVAVNGDRLILIGNSSEGSLHRSSRFARIFDSNFAPVTPRFQLNFGFALSGDTEPVNGGWIAAWTTKSTHDAPRASVVFAKINLDGTFVTGGIASSYPGNGTPTVVSNGGEAATEAMIMYTQNRDPVNPAINDSNAIRAMRIGADGTALSGQITLIDEQGLQTQPAAIFDGTEYVMTWTDQRNYPFPAQNRDDIFAARVAVDGTVLDPGGFPVADSFRPETHGDVGAAGGEVMFAYNSFRHEAPWGSYRLVTRGMDAPASAPLAVLSTPGFDRERDQAVKIQFNRPIMGIDVADVIVEDLTTNTTLPASAFTIDVIPANTQPWTYRWKYTAGRMPDGFYKATLPAGAVTDFAGNPTTSDIVINFRVFAGDADNNGVIDFDDYSHIDFGFNNNLTGFSNGDFDYNGVVDFDDYSLIDQAFNSQPGQRPVAVALPPATPGKLGGAKFGNGGKATA